VAKAKTAKKANNTDPPGFLDFLADAGFGFWSGLVKAVPNIFDILAAPPSVFGGFVKKLFPHHIQPKVSWPFTKWDFIADPAGIGLAAEITGMFYRPEAPETLEGVKDYINDVSTSGNTAGATLLTVTSAASLIPIGHVSEAVDEVWRLPWVQAILNISYDASSAAYFIGYKPLIRRYMLSQYLSEIPEPYRLADFYVKGGINYETYRDAFHQWGLDDIWVNAWAHSQYTWPSVEQLFNLYWRGHISEETLREWMRYLGYKEDAINFLVKLAERIPPASDLITMCVREAFTPEVYERVAPETPPEFIEWMRKQGFSETWSRRYWVAHYRRMGVEQAWRAFYRGRFSKEQLETFLKYADIHPDDRAVLTDEKVMYDLPTIRELGYGYDVGVYTKEDIEWYRKAAGLSPEDARKAAEAMVAYRSEAEREALRREYMYAYARGEITLEDFRAKLEELKTSKDKIPLWLERAELYKRRTTKATPANEPLSITRSTAQWLFEHDVWTEEQFREALKELGYPDGAIEAYLEQSKRRKEERKPEPKRLSEAKLEDLAFYGIITEAEWRNGLIALGYTETDANKLIQLAKEEWARKEEKPKVRRLSESDVIDAYEFGLYGIYADEDYYRQMNYPPDKIRWYAEHSVEKWYLDAGYSPEDARLLARLVYLKYEVPKLRTLYRNGWINKQQLIEGLKELGIPEPRLTEMAMNFIKAEQPERLRKERDLTKSEIIKGVKSGVITPQQAVYLLMDLGYDEWEAWYLLAIYKVVEAGDPEGYWEMRKIIELQKKARGLPAKEIPDELIILEQEQRRLKEELDKLRKTGAPEEEIAEVANKLTLVENKMRTIIGKLGLE